MPAQILKTMLTPEQLAERHIPLDDIILFKVVKRGVSDGGVAYADNAPEGQMFKVLKVGPDVKDIVPGEFIELWPDRDGICQMNASPGLLYCRRKSVVMKTEPWGALKN